MSLIFCSRTDDAEEWRLAFSDILPDLEFRVWPDVGNPNDVEFALVWDPMGERLLDFPNLKLIASLGAGVDHLLEATKLPEGIPMTRLVDDNLTQGMREWVLLYTLYCLRRVPEYLSLQSRQDWHRLAVPFSYERSVGIMGLGVLGQASALALRHVGFKVSGWSLSKKTLPGVKSFVGAEGLSQFISTADILVCLLPLTPITEGIIDGQLLQKLPYNACFINGARGALVVEADLINALFSGHLSHAVLDVTTIEPLPSDDPLWKVPNITITPHVASATNPQSGARLVCANIRRILNGELPKHIVNPDAGY